LQYAAIAMWNKKSNSFMVEKIFVA
jgi:hypothetical protein